MNDEPWTLESRVGQAEFAGGTMISAPMLQELNQGLVTVTGNLVTSCQWIVWEPAKADTGCLIDTIFCNALIP